MAKITIILVLVALAYIAKGAEGADDEAPNTDVLPPTGGFPFDMPNMQMPSLKEEDIMNMRSDPSTNTVVSGFSSSSSSSKKMVNGVLVEDKEHQKTVANDGQNVSVIES